jgi:hypothetical protein
MGIPQNPEGIMGEKNQRNKQQKKISSETVVH